MRETTHERILQRVATWPGVTVTRSTTAGELTEPRPAARPRATNDDTDDGAVLDPPVEGTLVRVGGTVVAGLREDGFLDLPVDRRLRDQLLTEGRVDRHPTVPAENRLSYRIDAPSDVAGAMWLLRVVHLAQCCHDGTLSRPAVARRVRSLRLSPELTRLVHGDDRTDSPEANAGRESVWSRDSRD